MKYQIKIRAEVLKMNGPICNRLEFSKLKEKFEVVDHAAIYQEALKRAELHLKHFDNYEDAENAINQLENIFVKQIWQEYEEQFPEHFFKDVEYENGASFYIDELEVKMELKKEAIEHYINWLRENSNKPIFEDGAKSELLQVVSVFHPYIEIAARDMKNGQVVVYDFTPSDFEGLEEEF